VIDFDSLVTQACISAFGDPVSIQLDVTQPVISTLGDGVTPLLGIWERALRELRDDPNTGAMSIVAKPQLGMSMEQLTSAGISVSALNNGVATVIVEGETWKIAVAEAPDSGGNVKISLLVTSLSQ
jgi:hypothetical protein